MPGRPAAPTHPPVRWSTLLCGSDRPFLSKYPAHGQGRPPYMLSASLKGLSRQSPRDTNPFHNPVTVVGLGNTFQKPHFLGLSSPAAKIFGLGLGLPPHHYCLSCPHIPGSHLPREATLTSWTQVTTRASSFLFF